MTYCLAAWKHRDVSDAAARGFDATRDAACCGGGGRRAAAAGDTTLERRAGWLAEF